MAPARLAAIAALGLAACSFGAGFDDARFRCDTAADCPAALSCQRGFCELAASDAQAGSDGNTTGHDGGSCQAASAAMDDFSDGSGWEAYGIGEGCIAAIEAGRAALERTTGEASCGLRSAGSYDVAGAMVWIEAVETAGGKPFAGFEIGSEEQGFLGIYRINDDLTLVRRSVDDGMTVESVPFEKAAHRYWGFAHADIGLEWRTSADGATWETLGSATFGSSGSFDCLRFQLHTTGEPGTNADVIMFDNLNRTGDM